MLDLERIYKDSGENSRLASLVQEVQRYEEENKQLIIDILRKVAEDECVIERLFSTIINRISRETGFFREADEVGITDYIISGFDERYKTKLEHDLYTKYGYKLTIQEDNIVIRLGKRRVLFTFHPIIDDDGYFREGFLKYSKRTHFGSKIKIIVELIKKGNFMDLDALVHELMHFFQYQGRYELPIEIKEVHASYHQLEGFTDHLTISRPLKSLNYVEEQIRKVCKMNGRRFNRHKLIFALNSVGTLRALGVSSVDIGLLFANHLGNWSYLFRVYPEIHSKIKDMMEEQQLTEDDIRNRIGENIIQHKLSHLKAKRIAIDELLNVSI